MRPKCRPVLEDALVVGLKRGWSRAHKHVEAPTPEDIQGAQLEAILVEVYERFNLPADQP